MILAITLTPALAVALILTALVATVICVRQFIRGDLADDYGEPLSGDKDWNVRR